MTREDFLASLSLVVNLISIADTTIRVFRARWN
jgi:hypothetical protein